MNTAGPDWIIVSSKATANIGLRALIPTIICTALALVIVALRWYSRMFQTRKIALEDYMILFALILSMGMAGSTAGEFILDTGNTNDKVKASLIPIMMRLVYAQSICFHLSINLVKASILVQYTKTFDSITPIRWVCFFVSAGVAGALLWGVLGVMCMCDPIHKYWYVQTPGTCIDAQQHFWSTAIMGIILDWIIWIMPIPVVGRLRLPARQKVGLLIMFGLGIFVCIVSILRLVLVHDAVQAQDMTMSGTYALIWSTMEVNVAIICACLLVMKPFFACLFPVAISESRPTAREHRVILASMAILNSDNHLIND